MKPFKHISLFIGVVIMLGVLACGGGKYSDAKSIMKKQADIMENYVTGLENAKSAEDITSVITAYTNEMKTLIPDIKNYMKKYPELADQQNTPPELEAEAARLKEIAARMPQASMNMVKYMMDSAVQKALTEMGTTMKALNPS